MSLPIILVGNKDDLEEYREVTKGDGERLAIRYNLSFFESSVKENVNVEQIFFHLLKRIVFGNSTNMDDSSAKPKKSACITQ